MAAMLRMRMPCSFTVTGPCPALFTWKCDSFAVWPSRSAVMSMPNASAHLCRNVNGGSIVPASIAT